MRKQWKEELLRLDHIASTYNAGEIERYGYIHLRGLFDEVGARMSKQRADEWLAREGFDHRVDVDFADNILGIVEWAKLKRRSPWTSYTFAIYGDFYDRTDGFLCPHFFRSKADAEELRNTPLESLTEAALSKLTVLR